MGRLIGYEVDYARTYIDSSVSQPIPNLDYKYLFPITTYEAVHKTPEEGATTLLQDINEVYRRISTKQDLITGGISGQLMTWTGVNGVIGSTEVIRHINGVSVDRSNRKIPSEIAVGEALDLKANLAELNEHKGDLSSHIDEDERARWNSMATGAELSEHLGNESIHVTEDDKTRWNGMTPISTVESHTQDFTNPHRVDAHQTGTYTRYEIDEMFESIRESFFNYRNIEFDERTSRAILVEYTEDNWNPNYVLAYQESLPEVTDQSLTYFALRPATDYATNESSECLIYVKRPARTWIEVGSQQMQPGDMVIRYPDGVMCVWIQGRFNMIYTNSYAPSSAGSTIGDGGSSDALWRPILTADCILSWTRSNETNPPNPVSIKGADGYTPVKGIDYFDGAPGIGVAEGGEPLNVLVKTDGEDYETEWRSLGSLIADYLNSGGYWPGGTGGGASSWEELLNKPEISQETGDGENALMSQAAISNELNSIDERLNSIESSIGNTDGGGGIYSELQAHLNDTNNPHNLSPVSIGAVSESDFTQHTLNQDNPHGVTAEQIGLGEVDNTSDINKPISNLTQAAIDAVSQRVTAINQSLESSSLVTNVLWDDSQCILTVTFKDGSETVVQIPIIDIFRSIFYDEDEHELVLTLPDNTEHAIPVQSLITRYSGSESDNVKVVVNNSTIEANVTTGSITGNELANDIHIPGNPTTTTQLQSDDSNKLATTKYVKEAVINSLDASNVDRPLSANMGKYLNDNKPSREDVIQIIVDTAMLNVIDNLGSEDIHSALSANMGRELYLTKAPKVHTAPSGSTFGRATVDLFGHTRAADTDPRMDGEMDIGTDDGRYARADHRHPTDVTRAPINWPDEEHGLLALTGEPRAANPEIGVYDDRIATTLWVHENFPPIPNEDLISMLNEAFENTEELEILLE